MSSPIGREVLQVPVEEEMKRSYLDYAMSVIIARALPDSTSTRRSKMCR
jgi:DNA gyrase subunit A